MDCAPPSPPPPYPTAPGYDRQRSSSFTKLQTIDFQNNLIRRSSLGNSNSNKKNGQLATFQEETVVTIPNLVHSPVPIHTMHIIEGSRRSSEVHFPHGSDPQKEADIQSPWKALRQLIIPFLIAGIGNVSAGIVLDDVQKWDSFENIPQLMILVPALLGLKGNVEMTLASRMSTHANLGNMEQSSTMKKMIMGNMALVQCQASTVGMIAPLVAIALSVVSGAAENHGGVTFSKSILVIASSVITTNIANLILGTLMCTVIVVSHKLRINPDNIATPIAASLGDISTLILLAYFSNLLYKNLQSLPWLPGTALLFFMLLTPIWAYIARKNKFTRHVVVNGWIPILGAMILQNSGGMIMEKALHRFEKLAPFQPVINGIGGNIAAIQSSRLSTWLHQTVPKGQLPHSHSRICIFPFANFFQSDAHSKMARILLAIAAPSHFLFLIIIRFWRKHFQFTVLFTTIYLASTLIQISILLYIAYMMVLLMWKKKMDPDNFALPFITALADLFGSVILAVAFCLLAAINDPNGSVRND